MKKSLVLWALCAASQQSSIILSLELPEGDVPAKAIEYRQTKPSIWSFCGKVFVWVSIVATICKVQDMHPRLDPKQPFVCANVYESCLPDWLENHKICVHTETSSHPAFYEKIPQFLRKQCKYPHGPGNPQQLTEKELHSLQPKRYCTQGAPIQEISLICRYEPR